MSVSLSLVVVGPLVDFGLGRFLEALVLRRDERKEGIGDRRLRGRLEMRPVGKSSGVRPCAVKDVTAAQATSATASRPSALGRGIPIWAVLRRVSEQGSQL